MRLQRPGMLGKCQNAERRQKRRHQANSSLPLWKQVVWEVREWFRGEERRQNERYLVLNSC